MRSQLLILLFLVSSEGLFFNNKQSIWSLFSKKDKKPNVHHYHLHYYPQPLKVLSLPIHAPEKRTLDQIHEEKFRSLGWSDEEYEIPDPKIIYPSKLDTLWKEGQKSPYVWDSNLFESHPPKDANDILVQVPLHQQIIFQVPKEKEESSFLGRLLQKIQTIRKFFSGKTDSEDGWENRIDHKSLTADLNDYLLLINQKKEKASR